MRSMVEGLSDAELTPPPPSEYSNFTSALGFATLPEALRGKAVEQDLVRYQHHVLGLRLCDQQAVERVLVGDVQLAGEPGVVNCDRQFGKALRRDDRLEVVREQRRLRQLADAEQIGRAHV